MQRVCGRGGMSTVYAARDLRFGHVERVCAVKEMIDRTQDYQTRLARLANFEREASLLATLSHPAIPKIYDYFTNGGLIYLVLEFIEGEDLERALARATEPLPENQVIEWGIQIVDVLSYLHEHQPDPIVFRDMKPSNIMLRTDGSLSLIDFGIARTFQPLQRGTMIGTEGYAPPEQYRGLSEPRGDIYAAGATLHHLATASDPRLEPPFTFHQRPPRSLRPELSEALEAVIMRAVAYAPADRHLSAAAMKQALVEARGGRAESPLPAGPLSTQLLSRATPAATREVVAPVERLRWSLQTADEVRGGASAAEGRAYIGSYDHHLYAIDLASGDIAWRFRANRGIVSRPLISGESVIVASEDHAVYALEAASGSLLWSFRTAMPVRSSAALYGDALVIGSDDGYCYCLDIAQGQMLWRQRAWGPIRSSPLVVDARILFGSDDGSVYALSAVDGRPRWRRQLGRPVLSSLAAGVDVAVVGCTDGSIYGLDLTTGQECWSLQTGAPVIASPRIAGDVAVVGSANGRLYGLGLADGDVRWAVSLGNQITASAALSGSRGYVGTVDGDLVCFDIESGGACWSYRVGSALTGAPAVEGATIVIGCLDGRVLGLRS